MGTDFKRIHWNAFLFLLTLTSVSAAKKEEIEILLNEINGFIFPSMETFLFVWTWGQINVMGMFFYFQDER